MTNKVFRPNLDDVERLSYGKAAFRKRGTGSRLVCHRLNRDERVAYDIAKGVSYLTLNGTGYRKNRKGSPLVNTFRQRCDALSQLCIMIEKRADLDTVIIDFSTLRARNDATYVNGILEHVFQKKYHDLYQCIMDPDDENGDASSALSLLMDWNAVLTKPIWAVKQRVIQISCDRDVAKGLVKDVLNETHNFTFDETESDEATIALEGLECIADMMNSTDDVFEMDLKPTKTIQNHELEIEESSSTNSIDWNDI